MSLETAEIVKGFSGNCDVTGIERQVEGQIGHP